MLILSKIIPRSWFQAVLLAVAGLFRTEGADAPSGFGAMLLDPQRPLRVEQAAGWAQSGGWDWLRVGSQPAGDTGTGVALIFWPGARFERADFSAEITTARLAADPWEVYRAAQARRLTNVSAQAYEIGNEPDLYFTTDLPDRMALTLKAAWWAIKSAQPDATVLMPSLAARPGPYATQLAGNGILSFTDAWNIHLYGWAADFPGAVAEHRRFLGRYGGGRLPVWVTETGFAEFPALPPPAPPVMLARQRAFFERVTVAAPFSQISQQWAFVLGARLEQGQDYGLNEPDWTPRPALEALIALTRDLHEWSPVFTLQERTRNEPAGLVLARGNRWRTLLFTPNRRADFDLPPLPGVPDANPPPTAPATSLHEFHLTFPDDFGPLRVGLAGVDGTLITNRLDFTASAATNLFLETVARRFTVEGCDWRPVAPARGTPSLHQPRFTPQLAVVPISPPSPVVISLAFPSNAVAIDKASITYRRPRDRDLTVTVRLDNFGPQTVSGRWQMTLPSGWTVDNKSALAGNAEVAAGTTIQSEVLLHPAPGRSSALRESLIARWWGGDRRRDVTSVVLAPRRIDGEPFTVTALPADWLPTEANARWERTELADGVTRLRLTELPPGVTTGLLLPLPAALRLQRDDLLRLRVRAAGPDSTFRRRVELLTPGRQVFRHGDDWTVDETWQTLEFRIGDFTPAFWSRADPTGHNPPTAARYVRLGLFGLQPGATVELGAAELLRPPPASGAR